MFDFSVLPGCIFTEGALTHMWKSASGIAIPSQGQNLSLIPRYIFAKLEKLSFSMANIRDICNSALHHYKNVFLN